MVIHAVLLTAVHPQPVAAVTGTYPVDEPAPTVTPGGLIAATQEVVNDHAPDAFAPTLFLAPTAQ